MDEKQFSRIFIDLLCEYSRNRPISNYEASIVFADFIKWLDYKEKKTDSQQAKTDALELIRKLKEDEKYKELRGNLVVVAHWQDFKLEDATNLGIFERFEDGYFYVVGDKRGYRHCRKVSRNRLQK